MIPIKKDAFRLRWLLNFTAALAMAAPVIAAQASTTEVEAESSIEKKKPRRGGGSSADRPKRGRNSGGSNTRPSRPSRPSKPPSRVDRPSRPSKPPSRVDRPSRPSKPPGRVDRPSRPSKPPSRVDRPSRPSKPPGRVDRPSRPSKPPGRVDRPSRPSKPPGRVDRPSRPSKPPGRVDRPSRPSKPPGRVDRPSRPSKPPGRVDRPSRPGKPGNIGRRPNRRVNPDWDRRQRNTVKRIRDRHKRYKRWSRSDYRNHHRNARKINRRLVQVRRQWSDLQRREWNRVWNPRIERRRSWRSHWRNHYHRRIVRSIHWDIRNRSRWDRRYGIYISNRYDLRPIHPIWPVYPIELPVQYPDTDYWSYNDVLNMAYNMEFMAHELYETLEGDLIGNSNEEQQILSAMYDAVEASQIYVDRAHENYGDYSDSIYELFHLELMVANAKPYMQSYLVSEHVKSNFRLLEYYVADLLWQYRAHID